MSLRAVLFISHAWNLKSHYNDLTVLLDSITNLVWDNVSVTEDKAIQIATGDNEAPQKIQLLCERRDAIHLSLQNVDGELRQLSEDIVQVRKNYFEMEEHKNPVSDLSYAKFLRERRKAELDLKYRGIDVAAAICDAERDIQRLTDLIARLQGKQHLLQLESVRCEKSLHRLEDCLRDIDDSARLFGKHGDPRQYLLQNSSNLALAIHNRIASAQAVLVIVYPDSEYRTWIEFEYQTAFALGKPLIGILRDDITDSLPPDLSRLGMLPVRWDRQAIQAALEPIC
jgi:hypothetical protein